MPKEAKGLRGKKEEKLSKKKHKGVRWGQKWSTGTRLAQKGPMEAQGDQKDIKQVQISGQIEQKEVKQGQQAKMDQKNIAISGLKL